MTNWKNLTTLAQLEEISSLSQSAPVLIFKHSTRCSISAAALNRLERNWDAEKVGELQPFFLDLIAHRDISNGIAEKYGVEHQSPQMLLIEKDACTYEESHMGISFNGLIENIKPVSA